MLSTLLNWSLVHILFGSNFSKMRSASSSSSSSSASFRSALVRSVAFSLMAVGVCVVVALCVTIGLAEHSPQLSGFSFSGFRVLNTHAVVGTISCCTLLVVMCVSAAFRSSFYSGRFVALSSVAKCAASGGLIFAAVTGYLAKEQKPRPDHLYSIHGLLAFTGSLCLAGLLVTSVFFIPCWRHWKEQHLLFGLFSCISLVVANVLGGQFYIDRIENYAPYDGFAFRYTFLYQGINISQCVLVILLVFLVHLIIVSRGEAKIEVISVNSDERYEQQYEQ